MQPVPARDRPLLALLDGYSLAYRAFFALPEDLRTTTGQLTNAVYGFTSMLIKLLAEQKPEGLAAVFDRGRPAERLELMPTYKANRSESPDTFKSQLPLIDEVLTALAIPKLFVEGHEADDLDRHLRRRGGRAGLGRADRHGRPGRVPGHRRPRPGALHAARDQRHDPHGHRCRPGEVRGRARPLPDAGRAARRPQRQHPGRPGRRGQDRVEAAERLRDARGDLRAPGRDPRRQGARDAERSTATRSSPVTAWRRCTATCRCRRPSTRCTWATSTPTRCARSSTRWSSARCGTGCGRPCWTPSRSGRRRPTRQSPRRWPPAGWRPGWRRCPRVSPSR